MIRLADLEVGTEFILDSIDPILNRDFRKDLLDYGLLPGMTMKVFEKYKSAGKIVIQIGETRIAIRKDDADKLYCKAIS